MVVKQHIMNVVLVHGAFADGSGWEAVAKILKNDGYKVSVAHRQRELPACMLPLTARSIRIVQLRDKTSTGAPA
jgi:NADP-dependent 3-hydroxy acid dehydrogenase YdfG